MLYRPKLKNGQLAPLSWPIALFRLINALCWPLDDDVAKWVKIFDRCYFIFYLVVFIQHNEAETRFFTTNSDNFDRLLSGVPGYLVHIEMFFRCIHLGLHKEEFKRLLRKFYEDIYMEKHLFPQLYRRIQRQLMPTFTYSSTYLITLTFFVTTPLVSLYNQRRDLLFSMIYPYDIESLYIYLPTIIVSVWLTVINTSILFGESNIMAEIMMHLNARYVLLGEDLQRCANELLQKGNGATISQEFCVRVKQILKRNMELNRFAAQFQDCFSYRIFMIFAFAALQLCVLAFKVYTNLAESISFVTWMLSKITEMLAYGDIGSKLIATTNDVSFMYYNSNWENILSHSTNRAEDIKLMKLMVMAIEMNQKPFILTGLKYFKMSLQAVLAILNGAGSYFACLISFHKEDN